MKWIDLFCRTPLSEHVIAIFCIRDNTELDIFVRYLQEGVSMEVSGEYVELVL